MLLLSFLRYATVVVRRRMQSEWIFISLCDWHRQNETDKRKKKNCIMKKKTNETKKGEKRLYECMEILLQRPVRRRVRAATPPDPPPPTIEVRMWRGEGGICRLIFHNVIVAPESWTSLLISLTNFYSALWLGLCRVEPLSLSSVCLFLYNWLNWGDFWYLWECVRVMRRKNRLLFRSTKINTRWWEEEAILNCTRLKCKRFIFYINSNQILRLSENSA